jgi:hypothetical protein
VRHKYGPWIKEAAARIDALSVPRRRLEELGWLEFQADPPPETPHLHQFASLAVELCCFDEKGRWCRLERLLFAFVAATETLSSIRAPEGELAELYKLALLGATKMDEISFWFQVQFPPPAA